MSLALETLPHDPDQLRAMLASVSAERDEARAEVDKLQLLIGELQRMQFGRRSEQRDPDQTQLGLEDQEQAEGEDEAAEDAGSTDADRQVKQRAKPKRNRGHLPKHLPRIEQVIEPEEKTCPCCAGPMHAIGEDKSEQLDIIQAKLRVIVTRRPRYGCRACEGAVVQALAPDRPITGGMATPGFLAHILVSKYADHCPLHRQSEILKRGGIELDRSTLASWVGKTCWWLQPVYDHLMKTMLASSKIFADETKMPVLKPGNGKTKSGFLWGYAVDDRPWVGPSPPLVVYVYADGRGGKHVAKHLERFSGVVQVDAYPGYNILEKGNRPAGPIKLAFCWTHLRRRFYEFHKSTGSPIASEAMDRIGMLYAIEKKIRGFPARHRQTIRDRESRSIVDDLKPWLEKQHGRLSTKSKLAEAIAYALTRWDGFTLFLDDGRIELDTNVLERAIRPIVLTRKNALFAGSDRGAVHWAMASSIIETCRLNHVEPFAYLKDVLERMVSGRTKANQIDQSMPWNWEAVGHG
jgi:transposase